MDQEELKKLHKRAEHYVETSSKAVREVIYPQIEGFKKDYRNYLKNLAASSGIIVGAVTALMSSSISRIEWLTIFGFILLIIVVICTFLSFKRGLIRSVPYVQYLRKLSRELTNSSYSAVRFSRGEIAPYEFQEKEEEFKSSYDKWRNDHRGDEVDLNEDKFLSEMHRWYSEINLLSYILVLGIILVALSVVIPLF
tara:strand:+ start:2743 stop:3330 length:588 start_codon:yes stop_codon:yes gene_type:complete